MDGGGASDMASEKAGVLSAELTLCPVAARTSASIALRASCVDNLGAGPEGAVADGRGATGGLVTWVAGVCSV